jgi:hypothetical protein
LPAAAPFAESIWKHRPGYTYSNSIDDTSDATVAFDSRVNDQNNARDSRGLSDFNRRHRFISSGVYELPFFAHSQDIAGKVLGGWEVTGVLTPQTGLPFTPIDSAGGSAYGLSSTGIETPTFAPGFSCANAPTKGGVESRLSAWANVNAYVPDPHLTLSTGGISDATAFGHPPRNCISGPPRKNMDFTLGKNFRMTELQSLRFRVDFFNLTNHPSFANPSATDIESPRLVHPDYLSRCHAQASSVFPKVVLLMLWMQASGQRDAGCGRMARRNLRAVNSWGRCSSEKISGSIHAAVGNFGCCVARRSGTSWHRGEVSHHD